MMHVIKGSGRLVNKKWRVEVDMIEHGYIDVEARTPAEARGKAAEESDAFIGCNSEAIIGNVILNQ